MLEEEEQSKESPITDPEGPDFCSGKEEVPAGMQSPLSLLQSPSAGTSTRWSLLGSPAPRWNAPEAHSPQITAGTSTAPDPSGTAVPACFQQGEFDRNQIGLKASRDAGDSS